jgi:alpha-L-fucosidase
MLSNNAQGTRRQQTHSNKMVKSAASAIAMVSMLFVFNGSSICSAKEDTSGLIIDTESAADREARMAWWKESRFGMFVHWGLYSSAEGEWGERTFLHAAEWIQEHAAVPADVYQATMLPKFKPSVDFAKQWAQLAKQAGAKYVVFTNKHHEGFALHDSAQTEFDAKDVTGRDLHKEITEAIRSEGLRVGVYHSLWDWHHPDAPAGEGTVNVAGSSMADRKLPRYLDYLHAQVNEVTDGRYGAVDILWLDYSKPGFEGKNWKAKELVSLVRENQPNTLINNRLWSHQKMLNNTDDYWFGDFSTPEQHIPATGIPGVDWETCDTLNITWGWSKYATSYKSSNDLIHRLIDAVSKGGNYLLNIGPLPDGSIDPKTIERFQDIGEWMQVNGESIYGTQAGPFTKLPWGRATSKQIPDDTHRLYLHVFDWPRDGKLLIPGLKSTPSSCYLIDGINNQPIQFNQSQGELLLTGLPKEPVHPAATVIVINIDQAPKVNAYRINPSTDGSFTLEPSDSTTQNGVKYNDHSLRERSQLNNWKKGGVATYPLRVDTASTYSIEVEAAINDLEAGNKFVISVGKIKVPLTLETTGGKQSWKTLKAGSISLPLGEIDLELHCISRQDSGEIAISTIKLKPAK